jgi:PIN domain nuclease of toxin-antitoxin system
VILIDTHVLIWAVQSDPRLGRQAGKAVNEAADAGDLHLSAITPWEVALLAQKGRVSFSKDVGVWLEDALSFPGLQLTQLLPSIAVDSTRLPGAPPKDPADRIIIASARHLGVPLLTADRAILRYGAAGNVAVEDASK